MNEVETVWRSWQRLNSHDRPRFLHLPRQGCSWARWEPRGSRLVLILKVYDGEVPGEVLGPHLPSILIQVNELKGFAVFSGLIHAWDLRKVPPVGTANPRTPVQFRAWPPTFAPSTLRRADRLLIGSLGNGGRLLL